jgi:hypothetical protein
MTKTMSLRTALDQAVARTLTLEFGPNFNLSEAFLYQIEDAIYDALVDYHGADGDDEDSLADLRTKAERLAHVYDGATTLASFTEALS